MNLRMNLNSLKTSLRPPSKTRKTFKCLLTFQGKITCRLDYQDAPLFLTWEYSDEYAFQGSNRMLFMTGSNIASRLHFFRDLRRNLTWQHWEVQKTGLMSSDKVLSWDIASNLISVKCYDKKHYLNLTMLSTNYLLLSCQRQGVLNVF